MTVPFLNGDGRRARIGLVVPSVNTVMEPWASRVVPEGVSVLTSRMFLPAGITRDTLVAMDRTDGKSAIKQVSSVFPHVIAYGCTASSIVQGLAYDAHLRAEIEADYKVPATTAAHAILTGLKAFGAQAISIVSPYAKEVDEAEHRYFESAGLAVHGGACLGITDGFRLADPEPSALYDLGIKGWDKRSDALVISCLNTRSHAVITALEETLGKPVITSTQATLWHSLRLAGVTDPIQGYGRLLQMP